MAKLYFYYSAMNAGKSTMLLQSNYNYIERGMSTLIFSPSIDTRYGTGVVGSRIGLEAKAFSFDPDFDFLEFTKEKQKLDNNLSCVFIDEAQFLKKRQVLQLCDIADKLKIPVLAYGLRSDFKGEPFEGSLNLLVWADKLLEIKTVCFCGKKAINNARIDAAGNIIKDGSQIMIGDNLNYTSMCRKHFTEAMFENVEVL